MTYSLRKTIVSKGEIDQNHVVIVWLYLVHKKIA